MAGLIAQLDRRADIRIAFVGGFGLAPHKGCTARVDLTLQVVQFVEFLLQTCLIIGLLQKEVTGQRALTAARELFVVQTD